VQKYRIFSATFNLNLKYLDWARKPPFLLFLVQPIKNVKRKIIQMLIFYVLKMLFKTFRRFSGIFSMISIIADTDKFLANCFHILKGLSH
jgi:hypothetical protein